MNDTEGGSCLAGLMGYRVVGFLGLSDLLGGKEFDRLGIRRLDLLQA